VALTQASPATGTPPASGELNVLALIDHLVMGGAEMLLSQFAAAAPTAGINLSVTCLTERDGNPAAAALLDVGITPQNLDLPGRPGLRTLRAVRRHIATVNPDIVHTHLGTSDWIGGLVCRSLGIPMVCSVHGTLWGNDIETYCKRALVRGCAARIIAVSDSARRVYADRGWGSDRRLVTIHNGVDVAAAPGAGREVRRAFGWTEDHLVVGMVSALRPEKAHDLALEAIGLLRDAFPLLRLLIVGRGPAGDQIAQLAEPLGDTVVLTGARSDVMRCFDAFDVCLHPSRAEAFPTTLIEAMAASVPVLATAVGGIPEIVSDGETGVLVPAGASADVLAAALADLLRDPPRRQALGYAGRQKYEHEFTARPWVQSTRALYDEVLAESRVGLLARRRAQTRTRDLTGRNSHDG
jgi:glycosyltransferase involved in cell wall biosynthesis